MSDLKLFVLINGLEIVGKLVEETDTKFVLDHPLGLQVVPHASGAYQIQLVPFSAAGSEDEHDIYKGAIAAEVKKIPSDIESTYRSRTSRIQLL